MIDALQKFHGGIHFLLPKLFSSLGCHNATFPVFALTLWPFFVSPVAPLSASTSCVCSQQLLYIAHQILSVSHLLDMMNWSQASIPTSAWQPTLPQRLERSSLHIPNSRAARVWIHIRFHQLDMLQWVIWKKEVKQRLVSYSFGWWLLVNRGFPTTVSLCRVTDTMVSGELLQPWFWQPRIIDRSHTVRS